MEEKELLRLADDGCPHADPSSKPVGRPKMFLVVTFPQAVTRAMIGKEFCVDVDPYTLGSMTCSIVSTEDPADFQKLMDRFTTYAREDEDAQG